VIGGAGFDGNRSAKFDRDTAYRLGQPAGHADSGGSVNR
jgi:hypothetical protein